MEYTKEEIEDIIRKAFKARKMLIQALKDKNNYCVLSGNDVRLFWQNALDGAFQVTDQNKHIVCAGWQVITWKGSKAITLYFGDSFDEAFDVFNKKNSE